MKTKHLTEDDALLYCAKETSREDELWIEKHLDVCQSCKNLIKKCMSYLSFMNDVARNNISLESNEECLGDMDIANYIENKLSQAERIKIETHLSNCGRCSEIIAESKISLRHDLPKEDPPFSLENILGSVNKELRLKKLSDLLNEINMLLINLPQKIQGSFESTKNNLENLFRNTITFPTPRFAPSFGEHEANVLSPFGKVRFPFVFEWMPFEKADNYIVSIKDIGWELNTTKTRIEINTGKLDLNHENEYMWTLTIRKGDDPITEIIGFFSISSKGEIDELMEIENHLKSIESEQNRLILWASILEEKKFYMEAIENYKKAYSSESADYLAYRIACCYNNLELEELRDEWNLKIGD